MSLNISYKILLLDEFSQKARDITASVKHMQRSMDGLRASSLRTAQTLGEVGTVGGGAMSKVALASTLGTRRLNETSRAAANLAAKGVMLKKFGKGMRNYVTLPSIAAAAAALHIFSKFQTLETGFAAMLHSGEKAKVLMGKLTEFASKGVFTSTDVMGAGSQLVTAGVPVKNLQHELTTLGDIAAGTGAQISDIASSYTRVKMVGHAYFVDFRMAARAHIDLLGQMAKGLHISKQELMKFIRKGAISFEMYKKTLESMTNKEGIFHDQMRKHLHTLLGAGRSFIDNLELTGSAFGKLIDKTFNVTGTLLRFAEVLHDIRLGMPKFIKEHQLLVSILTKVTGALVVVGPVLLAVAGAIKVTTMALAALRVGLLAITGIFSPWVAAIFAVAIGAYEIWANWKPLVAWFDRKMPMLTELIRGIGSAVRCVVHLMHSLQNIFDKIGVSLLSPFIGLWNILKKVLHTGSEVSSTMRGINAPLETTQQGHYVRHLRYARPHTYGGLSAPAQAAPQAQHSKAELHIKVDDKSGIIKNMQMNTTGSVGFNLGHNMSDTYGGAT